MPIVDQKLLFASVALVFLAGALLASALRVPGPAGPRPVRWPAVAARLAGMGMVQLGALLLALAMAAALDLAGVESKDAAAPLLATGLVVGSLAAWRLSYDNPPLLRLSAMAVALATVWLLS